MSRRRFWAAAKMKNDAALLFALDRSTSLLLLNDSGSLTQSVSQSAAKKASYRVAARDGGG